MTMGLPDGPAAGPPHSELCSLREDTVLALPSDGSAVLQSRWGTWRQQRPAEAVRDALRRMSYGPVSLRNVIPDYPGYDTPAAARLSPDAAQLRGVLGALGHSVVHSVATDRGRLLLSVVPLTRGGALVPRPSDPGELHRLSRYSWVRRDPDGLRLESPLSGRRLEVHGEEAGALLAALRGADLTAVALTELLADRLPAATVRVCLAYLVAARLVVTARPDPRTGRAEFAEDRDPVFGPAASYGLLLYSGSVAADRADARSRDWRPAVGWPVQNQV